MLTDEQVENWRKALVVMPIPPFNMPIGIYALMAPREQIVDIVEKLQSVMNREIQKLNDSTGCPPEAWEPVEEKPTNIIRTRPRKAHSYDRKR